MKRTKSNFFNDLYNQPYDYNSRVRLYNSSKASLELVQRMSLLKRLKVHNGCVNSICWNNNGELILSGSDDQHLVLTNVYNYKVLKDYKTSHRANIFSAKFLPNNGDHRIVSCSGDGMILYTDLMRTSETFHNQFTCHNGTTYEIATVPGEPHSFLSCGEDCTVRYFDLRVKSSCNTLRCKEDILILRQRPVTAMSINPTMPHYLAIGCSDSSVGIYDRRMLSIGERNWTDEKSVNWTSPVSVFTVPEFEGHPCRITSLCYSPDGNDVLVSYSSDHIYLFSAKNQGSVCLKKDSMFEKSKNKRPPVRSPQPVRRLRLRGDWSDTGPDARPEREGGRRSGEIAQARPMLHTSLMQRMTDVLSRMLNDPATRAALSGDGGDNIQGVIDQHTENQQAEESNEINEERSNEMQIMDTESNYQALVEDSQDNMEISEENNFSSNPESLGANELEQSSSINNSEPVDEINIINDQSEHNSISINNGTNQTENLIQSHVSPRLPHDKIARNQIADGDNTHSDGGNDENYNDADDNSMTVDSTRDETMMENLQDRLTSMRDGFLEKHGSEPAVSLTYSDKSSTGATISLGVGNEVVRDSYHPGPSGSQSLNSKLVTTTIPSSSYDNKSIFNNKYDQVEEEDVYTDSDDEETEMSKKRREINPIEAEMDEAVANARASLGCDQSYDVDASKEFHVRQKYMGHRNASFFRTMIKEANFWGNDFVMSGSDCGHVFIWERETAKLCMLLEADQHVVNCLQPHPYLPMLATSGIDYDVKLWAPVNEEAHFDTSFAEDLQKRNAVMLEETKDTITVPAVFMIRMLACLNQIRGRGRRRRSGNEADELRGG
ncbi:DDB1- and CUL4-associated factor 6-like isoform X2 [Microplitis mediator]|uniref:DDB1- and CUL4-associated factor 6-like isoform X2 n=1 Tax=Microplitis mediator TaxID=375433 RepID=UPI002552E8D1|nr:DDB1- and CUL4-associated factor 6-like isoform X2 [Microplitis mediator]